jgi:hypothetical protein
MGGRGSTAATAATLKKGGKYTAHHPVYGDVKGTVTRIHQNGSIIGTVESSSRGFTGQTGVAFGAGQAQPSR